jgi:Cu-processing system permease protein
LAVLIGSSILLGAAFLALGILTSILVRERATAAGVAVGIWLLFVLIYDSALIGLLVADGGKVVGQAFLNFLLLLNPTDAYRLLNLTGNESAATLSGMLAPDSGGQLSAGLLLADLVAWVVLPLVAGSLVLSRRQL